MSLVNEIANIVRKVFYFVRCWAGQGLISSWTYEIMKIPYQNEIKQILSEQEFDILVPSLL
jgi:hypothetical protein